MKTKTLFFFILIILSVTSGISAQEPTTFIYKQIDTTKLELIVYKPEHFKPLTRYNTIVFFYGGGWVSGSIKQFEPFAKHLADKGLVAILVDYRVKKRQGTTPAESLKDAKSAIRYIREHAAELNVNPDKLIASGGSAVGHDLMHDHPYAERRFAQAHENLDKLIASGGSAGGHLAAACYTSKTINDVNDNLKFSSKPNALVLFNPVIDNSKDGYGYERVKDYWKDFSPMENIQKGFPPTIFFVGTKDKLIPVSTAQLFKHKIDSVGGRCDLNFFEGQGHGFFKKEGIQEEIITKVDVFLKSIGYVK